MIYEDSSLTQAIQDFYRTNDLSHVRKLMDYATFRDGLSVDAFVFLLRETQDLRVMRLNEKPKAEHSLWVTRCACNFLEESPVDKDDFPLYLYSALWHDLVEDRVKHERGKISPFDVDTKAKELEDKANGMLDRELSRNVFSVIRKLTKSDAQGYFEYVDQIYSGEDNLEEVAAFLKNCDMIVNCETSHVFTYVKQIKQFLKYFKKLSIDRTYFKNKDLDKERTRLVYDSSLRLAEVLHLKLLESLTKYEEERKVSDFGKRMWREAARIYDTEYHGYESVTSGVSLRDVIYNPVRVFDGTISTFMKFLDAKELVEIRRGLEKELQNQGRDYLALIGLWKLAEKFHFNPRFLISGL